MYSNTKMYCFVKHKLNGLINELQKFILIK